MKNICFYDVDTQKDFMDKTGALYVPNAEGIKPAIEALTKFALDCSYEYTDPQTGKIYCDIQGGYGNRLYPVFGSVDRHSANDSELKIFPPHCMNATEGQKKIKETPQNSAAFIENKAYSANELKHLMSAPAVYFEKQEVSVFSNANANLLTRFDAAVVYGVATEYCVKAAVLGMRKRGIDVLVVEDAIRGINPEGEFYAIEEMKAAGAKFIKTKDVLEGKVEEILKEMWR